MYLKIRKVIACTACLTATTTAIASSTPAHGEFLVQAYMISGNKTLATEYIQKALTKFTGRVSLSEIQQAAEAVQTEYAQNGYVATTLIPPQDITGGVVKIIINEWAPDRVGVRGDTLLDKQEVLDKVPSIRNVSILNKDDMENEIAFANLDPFRKYRASLHETDSGDRVIEIEVMEPEKLVRSTVVFDNTGTDTTGEHRVTAVLQKGDALLFDNTLTVMATASVEHPDKVAAVVASWHTPVRKTGWAIDGYLGKSIAKVAGATTVAGDLNFVGDSLVAGFRGIRRLESKGSWYPRMSIGVDYKRIDNTCSVGGYGDICGGAGADISAQTVSVGITAQRTGPLPDSIGASIHSNIPGGANNDNTAYAAARYGADAHFMMVRAHGSFMATPSWLKGWTLNARGMVQHSNDPLVSSEQIGIGGAQSVRGYQERELAGDSGGYFSIEGIGPNFGTEVVGLHPVFFYDYGKARRHDALPGEIASSSIAGIGFGLLSTYKSQWGDMGFRLQAAHALKDGSTTRNGDWRIHFTGSLSF